ncbi:MAG: STAS domain-containing protein [Leptolyngbya sp.]|nr:STAS domain-containing protein [Leptolyngbya sp.]
MSTSVAMHQDLIIIEISGSLTMAKTEQSLEQIKRSIKAQAGNLLLDLGHLSFVDSAGLAVLVRLQKLTNSMGIRMAICSLPAQIYQLLQLTSMFEFFEVFENREEFYQNWASQFPRGAAVPRLATLPVVSLTTE